MMIKLFRSATTMGRKYKRTIEGMDECLVLFEVSVINRYWGMDYMLYFQELGEYPLEIEIEETGTIGYISYIFSGSKDRKIENRKLNNEIIFKIKPAFIDVEASEKNKYAGEWLDFTFKKAFKVIKSGNDLFVLEREKSSTEEPLQAIRIDDLNYLLYSEDYEFLGFLMKDISAEELEELRKWNCFQ